MVEVPLRNKYEFYIDIEIMIQNLELEIVVDTDIEVPSGLNWWDLILAIVIRDCTLASRLNLKVVFGI